jgi:hypothetical protein
MTALRFSFPDGGFMKVRATFCTTTVTSPCVSRCPIVTAKTQFPAPDASMAIV